MDIQFLYSSFYICLMGAELVWLICLVVLGRFRGRPLVAIGRHSHNLWCVLWLYGHKNSLLLALVYLGMDQRLSDSSRCPDVRDHAVRLANICVEASVILVGILPQHGSQLTLDFAVCSYLRVEDNQLFMDYLREWKYPGWGHFGLVCLCYWDFIWSSWTVLFAKNINERMGSGAA